MPENTSRKDLEHRIEELERDMVRLKNAEQTLREQEEHYRMAIEQSSDGIVIVRGDNHLFVNNRYLEIFGYDKYEEIIGRPISMLVAPDDMERVTEFNRQRQQGLPAPARYEFKGIRKDGEQVYLEVCANSSSYQGKAVSLAFLRDITERRRTEDALHESEARYRTLVEQIPAITYIAAIDDVSTTLWVSPQIETLLGFSQAEYRHDPNIWLKQLHPEDRKRVLAEVDHSHKSKEPLISEYRMLTRDGRIVYFRDEAVIVHDAAGKPLCLQGIMFDVSEQKRAEEHIHTLTQELMKAQESERQRISRELHDKIAQDLSTLKIGCETLFDKYPSVPVETKQRVSELTKLLEGSITAVRDLTYNLHPTSLDQLGLVRTAFQYCEQFSEKNRVNVDFQSAGMDRVRLDFDTEINLYRLIQEGLNNIKKHADASNVTVRLISSSPNIILRMEDDGKGFDVKERLVAALNEKRMGLRSMEERVSLLHGKMRIQSRPMQGTRIVIEIPWKEKDRESKENHINRR